MKEYEPLKKEFELIEKRFSFIPKAKPDQVERYKEIRSLAEVFAKFLIRHVPASRELSLALTHLEEVVMWAINAIARNEERETTEDKFSFTCGNCGYVNDENDIS